MKVLVIGSGGREHALAWQCAQFDEVQHVFVAPGNAGTALENKITNIDIDSENITELVAFAKKESVDISIVGPEAPLVLGIVDQFSDINFGRKIKCKALNTPQKIKLYDTNKRFVGIGEINNLSEVLPKRLFT